MTAGGAGISLAADLFVDVFVQAPTSISNSGTIVAPTGISLSRVAGDLTIADGGKIRGTNHAILIDNRSSISSIQISGSTLTGGISNAGAIASGISLNIVSTFMGGIVNSGSISGGINLTTVQTFSGGIINSNDLDHIDLSAVTNFSGNISNSGAITGERPPVSQSAAAPSPGAIVDSGRFLGGSSHGIAIDSTSQIDETAGNAISITGPSFSGGLSSAGLISAAAGSGIYVSGATTFSGGITNAGTISAQVAINIVHSTITGAIVDSGDIFGSSYGIVIDSASTITSATTALHISGPTFTGGISNAGTTWAAAAGIAIANVSTFSGTISNAGAINGKTGNSFSSGSAGGSTIVNSGTISARRARPSMRPAASAVTIDQTGGSISGAVKLSSHADLLNITGGTVAGNIVGSGSSNTVDFNTGGTLHLQQQLHRHPSGQRHLRHRGAQRPRHRDRHDGEQRRHARRHRHHHLVDHIDNGGTLEPGLPGTAGGTLTIAGKLTFASSAPNISTPSAGQRQRIGIAGTAPSTTPPSPSPARSMSAPPTRS